MKSPSSNSRCLYTIELTRGMAALVILALHVILFGHDKYGFAFTNALNISYYLSAGIDIFFIISGFLMVHTTRRPEQRDPKEFLIKRFIRIYPAYWMVLAAILPVYYLKPEWAFGSAPIKPSVLLSFFLLPQSGPPLLNVSWSLVYEVYFYLLFAASLSFRPHRQAILLGVYFAASILAGHLFGFSTPVAQFFTSGYLVEFFAGMVLAYTWPVFPKIRFLPIVFFIASFLFLIFQPLPGISRSIDLGFPALLLFVGMLSVEKNEAPFPGKISHFFGRISYALYLIHVPILAGLPRLASSAGLSVSNPVLLFCAVVLSLGGAIILHYFFELKIQRLIKAVFTERHIQLKTCSIEEY